MKIELSGHYGVKRILLTSVPSVIMMIIISVYSIIDGIFVSNYAGTTAFAALNLIFPALMIIGALGLMIGTGGSALVSKTIGEGDRDKANQIFTMLIKFALLLGTLLGILFFIFIEDVAIWLGAEGAMIADCVLYGRICLISMPAFVLQMAFQSFFMTAEKPSLGTKLSIASGVTNVILDYLFVALCGWGLTGAAIATMLAQMVGGLYPLYYFTSRRANKSSLKFVTSRIEWCHIIKSCTNGLSEYVGNISLSIVSMCYNIQLMKLIGENGVAAYGILMYIGFIFGAIFIGYNIAVAPVIGYNYGADNKKELNSLLRKSLIILSITGLLLTGISELLSTLIAKAFVSYDPILEALTIRAIRIYMISFTLCGINMFVSAWFTALNNGIVSAVAAFTRTLIFELGCVFILPLFFGLDGVWMSVDVADFMALILSVILLKSFKKRYGY